MMMMIKC